ncbi:MAG: hydrogenase maturation protease [Acidimicrobiales bacterium]
MNVVAVIGMGNPFRRDDGVGLEVVRRAADDLPEGVPVVEVDGEPARLLEAWSGADTAVIVDSVRSDASAGTVHRFEIRAGSEAFPAWRPGTSSHGAGLAAAVGLGRALDQLPPHLVVLGVEGQTFSEGPGLTQAVAAVIDDVAQRVLTEVRAMRDADVPQ